VPFCPFDISPCRHSTPPHSMPFIPLLGSFHIQHSVVCHSGMHLNYLVCYYWASRSHTKSCMLFFVKVVPHPQTAPICFPECRFKPFLSILFLICKMHLFIANLPIMYVTFSIIQDKYKDKLFYRGLITKTSYDSISI